MQRNFLLGREKKYSKPLTWDEILLMWQTKKELFFVGNNIDEFLFQSLELELSQKIFPKIFFSVISQENVLTKF